MSWQMLYLESKVIKVICEFCEVSNFVKCMFVLKGEGVTAVNSHIIRPTFILKCFSPHS